MLAIGKTWMAKKEEVTSREWFIVDADDQIVGRLATRIATVLMGKHKPDYTPNVDSGDYVRLYQIVDGGKEQLIGEIKGSRGTQSEHATIQGTTNGKKLVLIIRSEVSSDDEVFLIDNLQITGR